MDSRQIERRLPHMRYQQRLQRRADRLMRATPRPRRWTKEDPSHRLHEMSRILLQDRLTTRRIAWISSVTLGLLTSEADQSYPLETGGVLIGYWANENTAVVTAGMGPGPASVHGRYSYRHDHVWEASQIALHYERSGRAEVYIGDRHTHPDASSGNLSFVDRYSIRRVIKAREARLSHPLMTVLFGKPANWQIATWGGQFKSAWPWGQRLQVNPIDLQEFGRADPA
jgi:integrative and conjugative element protein (TIGR02256 family)